MTRVLSTLRRGLHPLMTLLPAVMAFTLGGCAGRAVSLRPGQLPEVVGALQRDPLTFRRVREFGGAEIDIRGPLGAISVEQLEGEAISFPGETRVEINSKNDTLRFGGDAAGRVFPLSDLRVAYIEAEEVHVVPGTEVPGTQLKAGRLAGGLVLVTIGIPVIIGGAVLTAKSASSGGWFSGLGEIVGVTTIVVGLGATIPGIWLLATSSGATVAKAAPAPVTLQFAGDSARLQVQF